MRKSSKYTIDWLLQKFYNGDELEYLYFLDPAKQDNSDYDTSYFSQRFNSSFEVDDKLFNSIEHWIMYQKAILFEDYSIGNKIINSENIIEARSFERLIRGFDEIVWKRERFRIVFEGNIHKFNQSRNLGELLLKTQNKILVEANPNDKIWGVGMSVEHSDIDNISLWEGQNLYGFILMDVRDFLLNFGFFDKLKIDLVPPWIKYPNISPVSMFWRMGEGEDYLEKFYKTFFRLSDRDKTIFKLTHLKPEDWRVCLDT